MQPVVTVWAKVALPGFHRWPGATGRRAYLADRHRHLFHIRAEVAAGHDDRDVEFHDLQDLIRDWWGPDTRDHGSNSCEHLARALGQYLTDEGCTVVSVEVSEDDECGAVVRFTGGPA